MLGRPSADQTEYFPAGASLGKIKKQIEETKLQNPETKPCKKLLHATLHCKHRNAPVPSDASPYLPRRCRQIGLDAKGITPELLRLKFYCS
jgi:hypothetical protein